MQHRYLALILFLALTVSAGAIPCRSCGREIEGDYFEFIDEAVGGKANICRQCSTNAPKCFHCNVPFQNGLRTLADGRQVCERDAADGLEDERELVTDSVVSIFQKTYERFWGPRTDDILRASILTLLRHPNTTLCDVPLLLLNREVRARLTKHLDDPIGLRPFWQERYIAQGRVGMAEKGEY